MKLIYKFAENDQELAGVYAVRSQVFVEEQGITEALVFGGDSNDDEMNVAVLEGETVIGTARVVCRPSAIMGHGKGHCNRTL